MFNIFWKKNNTNFYKFKDPQDTPCFTCNHVLEKDREILYVTHDVDDGSWQFLCGLNDHSETNARIISLKNITEIDPTVNDLFEMPVGFGAERKSINEKWIPFKRRL